MALGLVAVAPKLIFGACPDVDRVEYATFEGLASSFVGKWYLTSADVDFYNMAPFIGCSFAELKLADASNKNLVKIHARTFSYLGFTYISLLMHAKCDPVSKKCECWEEGEAEDDKNKDCFKYLAKYPEVDPEFFVMYDCIPATIFWIIPIPFFNT